MYNKKVKKEDSRSLSERGKYHTMRAKRNSVNPETGQPYSDYERGISSGWLRHQKIQNSIYKSKKDNSSYQKSNKTKRVVSVPAWYDKYEKTLEERYNRSKVQNYTDEELEIALKKNLFN